MIRFFCAALSAVLILMTETAMAADYPAPKQGEWIITTSGAVVRAACDFVPGNRRTILEPRTTTTIETATKG